MVLDKIYSIHDPEFAEYGRVIEGMDVSDIVAEGKKTSFQIGGSAYEASKESFEKLPIAEQIRKECFGELPVQIGYCYGRNNKLNALEWHYCSEVNIAISDLVLILAKRCEYQNGVIDSTKVKAFLLKEGDAVEVYATSLHYCPCEVSEDGFGSVVALPLGTNTPLDEKASDPLLFSKNKWLIAHEDNAELIAKGAVSGITGPNYEIKM